jgi:hypothetical protein
LTGTNTFEGEAVSAINAMIDAHVKCTKCGTQGVGNCDCWSKPQVCQPVVGKKPMDMFVAVFNRHVNGADEKAKAEFVKKFGEDEWTSRIQPFEYKGIMTIFHVDPTRWTKWYAKRVCEIVNGMKYRDIKAILTPKD